MGQTRMLPDCALGKREKGDASGNSNRDGFNPTVAIGTGEARYALRSPKNRPGADLPSLPLLLPAQPVDATQALNLSAGVSNCKVSRGRSLS